VVWLVLDALRQDIVGEYVRRGGFADLLRNGAYFSRAFAQGSWTYPSFFSFLTARYPFNCGVSKLLYEDGRLQSVCSDFDEACPTLFSILRQSGYRVASILDGWGVTIRTTAGQEHREDRYFEQNWGWVFGQGRRFLTLGEQREAILGYVNDSRPTSPFFLFVRSLYTHSPYRGIFKDSAYVTRMSQQNWRFRLVEGFIRGLKRFEDECLKPLLESLAGTNRLENTIIILCSDHGDMFWNVEADLRASTPDEEAWRHQLEPYNALVKVPLLISGANMTGVCPQRLRLMDIVPTLLDELQIAYDAEQFDGVSLRRTTDRVLYADSAGQGSGGVAYQAEGPKILMSGRLGTVQYDLTNDDYEQLQLRSNAAHRVSEVREFVARSDRGSGVITSGSDDALMRRLRALGYVD
jgi:arylsulfatase A-like enzyme